MIALKIAKVSKNFGGLSAVKNVSLELEVGERRGLLGPNGAGKTTLFHLVTGVHPVTSGKIEMFGRDITRLKPHQRVAVGLSRTFQITNLFKALTVEQNIMLSLQACSWSKFSMLKDVKKHDELRDRVLEELELWGFSDRRSRTVSDLSYGEQRTLEIVIAVAQRPRVLLLDEPTSGLSPAETQETATVISALPKEMTILVVEHDMDVAFALCHSLTVMHLGEVIETGSVESVRASRKVQDVYLGGELPT